jgi:hypothetical protein
VHGPWVRSITCSMSTSPTRSHRHAGKRYVVDVRTGARASSSRCSAKEPDHRRGRRLFLQLTDSIRAAGDERAGWRGDTETFHSRFLELRHHRRQRAPAVAFGARHGMMAGARAQLPPITVSEPTVRTVQLTLYAGGRFQPCWCAPVRCHGAAARTNSAALARTAGRDAGGPVATVPMPAYRVAAGYAARLAGDARRVARALDASSTRRRRAGGGAV